MYATALAAGETMFARALGEPDPATRMVLLIRAATLFPLRPTIREWAAITPTAGDLLPPSAQLAVALNGLRHTPSSPQLRFWTAVAAMRAGEFEVAQICLDGMPAGWPQTRFLADLLNASLENERESP